jgi:hypothetical protein
MGEHEPSLTPATAATRSRARQASETVRAEAYREGRFRRMRRQAATITRAVRAGRARVRAAPVDASVDGEALRELVAEAAAELIDANRVIRVL